MDPLQIFIGYDSRETVTYHVLAHSILRQTSMTVAFIPLIQSTLRAQGLYTRERGSMESTEFSLTRFLVPYLSNYHGVSIFMDCDMLCRTDLRQLMSSLMSDRDDHAVLVCQHAYTPKTTIKMDGQIQTTYPRKNWSSLIVFNNALCKNLSPEYVNTASALALHRFQWLHDHEIGSLPLEWNWLVDEYPKNTDAKILHYTLGGPWFRNHQNCDYAKEWLDELYLMYHPME